MQSVAPQRTSGRFDAHSLYKTSVKRRIYLLEWAFVPYLSVYYGALGLYRKFQQELVGNNAFVAVLRSRLSRQTTEDSH